VDLEVPCSSQGGGTSIRSKPHSPLSDQSFQLIFRRGMRKGTCSSSVLARDVIGSRPPAAFRSFDLCAGGGIGGLKRRLHARGGTSADAKRALAKWVSTKSFPGNEPSIPPRLPRFSTRSRGDVKIILADTKPMRRREIRRQRRRRFTVRNGLSVLEFRSTVFLESYHLPSLWPLREQPSRLRAVHC
jgi:hypothetical protein